MLLVSEEDRKGFNSSDREEHLLILTQICQFHHAEVDVSLGKTASKIKVFTDRNTNEYNLF